MQEPVYCYKDTENSLKIASFIRITSSQSEMPWSFPRHLHDDFLELSFVTEGDVEFECGHSNYHLRAGDIIIKNAGVLHAERSIPGKPYEQYCLGLSGVCNPGMPPNALIPDGLTPVIHTAEAFDYLRASFKYLFELNSAQRSRTEELRRQTIENMLTILNMLVKDTVDHSVPKQYSALTEQVLKHICLHFGEDISLDTIAKDLHISPSHLAHKFKDETGSTVNQYILSRRLGEAQMRLVFRDIPIKEIAAECGYQNLQYFYAVFKKHVGATPVELRDAYRKRKATAV